MEIRQLSRAMVRLGPITQDMLDNLLAGRIARTRTPEAAIRRARRSAPGRTGATDDYLTVYPNVTGLKHGSPVFYEGYPIGQVSAIEPLFDVLAHPAPAAPPFSRIESASAAFRC